MLYRCENCGKINKKGDMVYYISKYYVQYQFPTCSIECAENIKKREIKKLKDQIEDYKISPIHKDIW